MKILFISLGTPISIIVQLFALNGQKNKLTPYVVDKKYDTFEIHITRQVCLRLSNSPQKNLKRHPVKVLHFSRIYFGGNKEKNI
jgi:hypothetical protein